MFRWGNGLWRTGYVIITNYRLLYLLGNIKYNINDKIIILLNCLISIGI